MKTGILNINGEKVTLTGNIRDLGHGKQLEVIYSDGSKGFEHYEDIEDAPTKNIMKKQTTTKTLRIDTETIQALEKHAKEQNRSLNNLIETILMRFVEDNKQA